MNQHSVHTSFSPARGQLANEHHEPHRLQDGDYDFSRPDPNAYQFAIDPQIWRHLHDKPMRKTAPTERERDDIAAYMRASKNTYKPGVRFAPAIQAKAKGTSSLRVIMESEYEFRKKVQDLRGRSVAKHYAKRKGTSGMMEAEPELQASNVAVTKRVPTPAAPAVKKAALSYHDTTRDSITHKTEYMAFKKFDASSAATLTRESTIRFYKRGVVWFSKRAVTEIGLAPNDKISFLQDEVDPENWCIIKDPNGIALRNGNTRKDGCLLCNSVAATKEIIAVVDPEDNFRSIQFKLLTTPTITVDGKKPTGYAIIIGSAGINYPKK